MLIQPIKVQSIINRNLLNEHKTTQLRWTFVFTGAMFWHLFSGLKCDDDGKKWNVTLPRWDLIPGDLYRAKCAFRFAAASSRSLTSSGRRMVDTGAWTWGNPSHKSIRASGLAACRQAAGRRGRNERQTVLVCGAKALVHIVSGLINNKNSNDCNGFLLP